MHPRRRAVKAVAFAAFLLVFSLFHTGCQYAGTLALTSVTMGIAYYYTNIADQTFSFGLERMSTATMITLKKLGFSILDNSVEKDGERKIKAETEDLDIIIKLKRITHTCTKMKVTVREGITMDRATALEILAQTGETARKLRR